MNDQKSQGGECEALVSHWAILGLIGLRTEPEKKTRIRLILVKQETPSSKGKQMRMAVDY